MYRFLTVISTANSTSKLADSWGNRAWGSNSLGMGSHPNSVPCRLSSIIIFHTSIAAWQVSRAVLALYRFLLESQNLILSGIDYPGRVSIYRISQFSSYVKMICMCAVKVQFVYRVYNLLGQIRSSLPSLGLQPICISYPISTVCSYSFHINWLRYESYAQGAERMGSSNSQQLLHVFY